MKSRFLLQAFLYTTVALGMKFDETLGLSNAGDQNPGGLPFRSEDLIDSLFADDFDCIDRSMQLFASTLYLTVAALRGYRPSYAYPAFDQMTKGEIMQYLCCCRYNLKNSD